MSLTPLIDVIFILLVFFMLASNFLQWRSLELNVPGEGQASSQDVEPVVVRLGADGAITVDGRSVALEQLGVELPARTDGGVVLRPGAEVPLQRVVAVLDRLALAGHRDVTLIEE